MSPSQQCQSSEGKTSITFHRLVQPKLTWGLATLSVTTKGSWLSWGGLSCRFVSPLVPEIVRMKQMPDNISSHMEYEGAPPISNANDRAVKVLQFHFRFGFGSVLHRKPQFLFFPVSVLREIWVKQTINCKRNNVIREPRQLRPI